MLAEVTNLSWISQQNKRRRMEHSGSESMTAFEKSDVPEKLCGSMLWLFFAKRPQ